MELEQGCGLLQHRLVGSEEGHQRAVRVSGAFVLDLVAHGHSLGLEPGQDGRPLGLDLGQIGLDGPRTLRSTRLLRAFLHDLLRHVGLDVPVGRTVLQLSGVEPMHGLASGPARSALGRLDLDLCARGVALGRKFPACKVASELGQGLDRLTVRAERRCFEGLAIVRTGRCKVKVVAVFHWKLHDCV